ncbi:hypothetical protein N2152v2_001456 [Parachlorella kessleri]
MGLSTLPSGPSSNETRSSLQQRLAEAGVADWRAFSQPRYSKLTSTADIESAAVKIVELCREGLTAEGVERLFHQERGPWTSDLQEVFLPNMAYLRGLLRNVTFVQAPYEPAALTPLGRLGFQFRRTLEALMNFGYSVDAARVVVVQNPELLYQDLGGPVQQQKLQWVRETLGWPVTKLLSENLFGRNLRRMASRLSFVRHLGLPNPGSLAYIGIASEPVFLARVGKAAGREVSAGDFAEWVAAWLQTPEGQRWGFKPQSSR